MSSDGQYFEYWICSYFFKIKHLFSKIPLLTLQILKVKFEVTVYWCWNQRISKSKILFPKNILKMKSKKMKKIIFPSVSAVWVTLLQGENHCNYYFGISCYWVLLVQFVAIGFISLLLFGFVKTIENACRDVNQ